MNENRMKNEGGFSLIEMIIAIMIYGIVLSVAIGFVAQQNKLFHLGMDRMTSLQNLRYALQSLETDIPTLGTNLPGNQPGLVYAGADILAFTGDYASNVPNDVFASYIDLGAPTGQVSVPTTSQTLPNTSFTWPDTLYRTNAGTRSPAELLMYWFSQDSTTTRTDDYVMYRQVNTADPEVVTRNVLAAEGSVPFFRYIRRIDYASQASTIDSIPDSQLPIRHIERFHAVAADTGASALTDSIRAVRVSFRTTNGVTTGNERIASVSRIIYMPNAGFGTTMTCGSEPILGTTLAAVPFDTGGGLYASRLTWNAATDETSGESDVARYVIYRQEWPIGTDWGDPYLSIPAGNSTYQYLDQSVEPGTVYRYALAAQDCTPSLSTLTASGDVTIPF
ncbi:MAG: prepilin-type N-terminal cleavage/methylation domain-containing protein [Gemmatimonadales bacterium]|jgi:prepilin-type N-terminal cleavage/methylation domain-containing protein|nr:prepilin-type N-terminal cleavage/methylation domain-containing protein [Gemmatimonadales bacterium]MDG2240402.1 prepilin-type N-terminal cleavage/methylation domain-containing protein [Longimicrobiales bacterium]MBT3957845.1 prepilin-type N-terminal cleavage/methylation domain-containing protein [Gemmatimonadales bacterium]MBT4438316.1 prepilin-type N-terminal cleavage/methylation domain-containing protein [Gemmatimonadales bacterium]MBT6695718.1 prepilin-type N-terminal cleavage/methylatio